LDQGVQESGMMCLSSLPMYRYAIDLTSQAIRSVQTATFWPLFLVCHRRDIAVTDNVIGIIDTALMLQTP
jgi:hypothetical protein